MIHIPETAKPLLRCPWDGRSVNFNAWDMPSGRGSKYWVSCHGQERSVVVKDVIWLEMSRAEADNTLIALWTELVRALLR